MPRARRRRRRSAGQRGWGRPILVGLAAAFTLLVIFGSLIEIHTQSSGYRTSTDTGYGALVSGVVEASNRTGAELAALMGTAAQLPNQQVPHTARAEVQQGLDQAVLATAQQAYQAAHSVPPVPTGDVSSRLDRVMDDRASAVSGLRSTIDQLLGMVPLPVSGAPATSVAVSSAPLISISQAASAMTAEGLLLQGADDGYRELLAYLRLHRIPVHLPKSSWVGAPVDTAALGAVQLGATASALSASVALIPFHRLVITAVGLRPPAVATGGAGIVADSCSDPQSLVPGASPTVLPPTTSVSAVVTVTNCGTVPESGVVVTSVLAVADPTGSAPPPASSTGGSRATTSLRSGASEALTTADQAVSSGHRYTLTVSIAIPAGQADPTGSTQQFLLEITG